MQDKGNCYDPLSGSKFSYDWDFFGALFFTFTIPTCVGLCVPPVPPALKASMKAGDDPPLLPSAPTLCPYPAVLLSGYGNFSVSTTMGRVVTVVYSLFSIPLLMMILGDMEYLFLRV